VTSLEEEGFETAHGPALIEAFARYLMLAFDTLGGQGFDPIAASYLGRLAIRKAGERRGIDVNGDLLIQRHGQDEQERLALVPALERAEWLDPATGMPKA
jgi:hypothetical protein